MSRRDLFYRIMDIAGSGSVPSSEVINASLDRVIPALSSESPLVRPPDRNGNPGGLLLLPALPAIIVPDLHARIGYLTSLLQWTPPGMRQNVLRGLAEGKLQVVCVGDGFHAEARAVKRWQNAFEEFSGGFQTHSAMDEEMRESLGVMLIVMELKAAFPDFFHFLKGNHENIANENLDENRAFGKFVYEGAMVTSWFKKFISGKVFRKYYRFEKMLPGFAAGDRFCVTHAEPRRYHSRMELTDALIDREILYDLTWTRNGDAEDGSVQRYLKEFFPRSPEARMFGGHRPVTGHFNLRADGKYIQIHNPEIYNTVFIRNMTVFSLQRSFYTLPYKGVTHSGTNS